MNKKTLVLVLSSSVIIAACNNTGESTSTVSAKNSLNSTTALQDDRDFTLFPERADGVFESKEQNYGVQWIESTTNYPGVRLNAAFDHIENKYGSFTLMYGGCTGTQEDDLIAHPSLSPNSGRCYNDIWLYNHDTHNWVWVGGEPGTFTKDSNPKFATYAFAPSRIIVTNLEYPKSTPNALNKLEMFVYPEFLSAGGVGAYYNQYEELTLDALRYPIEHRALFCSGSPSDPAKYCRALSLTDYIYKRKLGFNGTAHKSTTQSQWDETGEQIGHYFFTGREPLSGDAASLLPNINEAFDTTFIYSGEYWWPPADDFIISNNNSADDYSYYHFGAHLMRGLVGARDHVGTIVHNPNAKSDGSGIQFYMAGDKSTVNILSEHAGKVTTHALIGGTSNIGSFGTITAGDTGTAPDSNEGFPVKPLVAYGLNANLNKIKTFDSGQGRTQFEQAEDLLTKKIPVNRTHPATTVSADGRYLYIFGGLGYSMTGNYLTKRDSHYAFDIVVEPKTIKNGAEVKASALNDLWRLDLVTGHYDYMNTGRGESNVWSCSKQANETNLCSPIMDRGAHVDLPGNHFTPPGLIGATMWESGGRLYMFGGSYGVVARHFTTFHENRCYSSAIWMFTPAKDGSPNGTWMSVANDSATCRTQTAATNYPSTQSDALSWADKNGQHHLFSGANLVVGDFYFFVINDRDKQKPLWEHWILNSRTPLDPQQDTTISMSVAPEHSTNQMWHGFDTLVSIPYEHFGLREIKITLFGYPDYSYKLAFRNPPQGFSIDSTRSTCRSVGQPDQDANIKGWIAQGGYNYECSFILKYQPEYASTAAGFVSVDLLDGTSTAIQTIDIPYSPRL